MTPSPEPWITTATDAGGMAVRLVVFVFILLLSFMAAVGVRELFRRAGPATGRALSRETHGTPWACIHCRTVSPAGRDRCVRCGADRASAEMRFAAVEAAPDILPEVVDVAQGSRLTLEHNAGAHTDGMTGHWRLRVNGVIVGSAARREGALAMLRAVRGAEVVIFDPYDAGAAPYPLEALIRSFEAPRLPLNVPCPEA